jgi:hypothetical protein
MDLLRYADGLRRDLATAAAAGGEDALAVADRLSATLEPAVRLMLLEALSDAAAEITRELAPGWVELRLRSGDAEFAVMPAPAEAQAPPAAPPVADEPGDGAVARINLRLPEQLKLAAERAAAGERLSVNGWLVRVVAAAVARDEGGDGPPAAGGRPGQSYTGWVR